MPKLLYHHILSLIAFCRIFYDLKLKHLPYEKLTLNLGITKPGFNLTLKVEVLSLNSESCDEMP